MPDYVPPVTTTGPDAPSTQPGAQPVALPERPSTPPAGVAADPVQQAPEATESAPEGGLLAGKFKSAADLEKAYLELQSKLGRPRQQQPEQDEQEQQPDQPPQGGIDLTPFRAEFQRDGKLSETSYEALSKMGFSRADVDQYIAGAQAMADRFIAEVTTPVGGLEGYKQMIQWAAQNLPAPEIVAFNQAIQSDNENLAKMAVHGLAAKWQAAEGKAPNLIHGGRASGGGYESMEQFKADLNDPRYKAGDKAFHAMVDRKLRATTAF